MSIPGVTNLSGSNRQLRDFAASLARGDRSIDEYEAWSAALRAAYAATIADAQMTAPGMVSAYQAELTWLEQVKEAQTLPLPPIRPDMHE